MLGITKNWLRMGVDVYGICTNNLAGVTAGVYIYGITRYWPGTRAVIYKLGITKIAWTGVWADVHGITRNWPRVWAGLYGITRHWPRCESYYLRLEPVCTVSRDIDPGWELVCTVSRENWPCIDESRCIRYHEEEPVYWPGMRAGLYGITRKSRYIDQGWEPVCTVLRGRGGIHTMYWPGMRAGVYGITRKRRYIDQGWEPVCTVSRGRGGILTRDENWCVRCHENWLGTSCP